ncbi:MAG: transporter associated domain-containing protein [Gammaproteobacteria bacterium]|nr:transporter associated domain-containing protein [Gammaproteobacteria bacterium]
MSEEKTPESARVKPLSWLERLSDFLSGEPKNREELLEVLRDAAERKILSKEILDMIESVLHVSDMQVRDVMVPRSQMIVLDVNAKLADILPVIIDSGHSRFPVMDAENVVGILLAKDLLAFSASQSSTIFQMSDAMRRAVFVPQSKRLDILLREFRVNRNHLAIVVDEYGHVAGLVTIEDVLEEIVGEIEDEYDIPDDRDITERDPGVFLIKAGTPIEDFNERFSTELSDDEFDTIGGLVLKAFGHFPRRGESIRIGSLRFKVLGGDSRRIHLLEMRRGK